MIPAIIACKVNRDANGHERTSSFRIAISAMPLKRTWITSRSMSASGEEQAIRSVRIQTAVAAGTPLNIPCCGRARLLSCMISIGD